MKIRMVVAMLILMAIVGTASAGTFIARGDPLQILETKPYGSCWYFPENGQGKYYDISPSIIGNRTYCTLTKSQTYGMPPGRYTVTYIEPAVVNGKIFRDVSWHNNTLVSTLSYSGSIYEGGSIAEVVRSDLTRIVTANGLNIVRESSLVIEEPSMRVIDIGRVGDNVFRIRGESNLINGTLVSISVDDKRYFAQHNDTFSYKTSIIRPDSASMGSWSKDMLMPLQTMPPGWHDILVTAGELATTVRFYVDEQEWGPAPTPTQYVKYLTNGDIAPEYITVIQTVEKIEYKDRWHTATPTPPITDALGDPIDYPYEPGRDIPVWVGILSLGIITAAVIVRGYEWK